jgi:predicted alpha-1,2-mannosidase
MEREPVDYVDPTIDTAKPRIRWVFSVGTARPGALVRLAPNTDPVGTWDSGYRYGSRSIACFSHLHSWQVSGVPVMPTTLEPRGDGFDRYASSFRHENEVFEAGYYAVTLDDIATRVEITSTRRVGFHRYRFPAGGRRALVFDLAAELGPCKMSASAIRRTGPSTFEGVVENDTTYRRNRRIRVYFVAEVDTPIASWTPIGPQPDENDAPGDDRGAWIGLDGSRETVLLKVAVSFTSIEGAKANLNAELPGWDFDAVRSESREEWNEALGRIRVEGGAEEDRVKFYTDLFRVLSAPQTMSDVDGAYCHTSSGTSRILRIEPGPDGGPSHQALCGHDGFWNSQWSTNIVLGLAYPDLLRDECRFLVDFARDGGLIPRGPSAGSYTFVMISAPTTPFLVSAWMKGVRDFDIESAYRGMVKNSLPGGLMGKAGYEFDSAIGGGIEEYLAKGYISAGRKVERAIHVDGAAQTLEYAFQDFALAELAQALGHHDDAKRYRERSRNYRNLFDAETGFMRPRLADGSPLEPFDPLSLTDFCEANSWQYTFHVMHDLPDLIGLMGGENRFIKRLDEAFTRAQPMNFYAPKPELERDKAYINYGNEPGRFTAHLFAHAGAPALTQKWARAVKRKTFSGITPLAFCEDDDIGKAAATSLLLALGLFDVRGGVIRRPLYELTAPLFERITFSLHPDYTLGGEFTIVTKGNPAQHEFIRSVRLDGEPIDRLWIRHDEFMKGGTLELEVGPEPEEALGSSREGRIPAR